MDIHELAKKAYDRAVAQKNLEEKQLGRMSLTHANGIWLCNAELICLLQSYQNRKEIVLIDSYNIPRKINPTELLELAQKRHQEVLNDWLIEYAELAKIRTARNAVE